MPERTCVSCKIKKERSAFVKITKTKTENIIVNPSSKELGRSLYVCKNKNCIDELLKQNKIEKKLKINSKINTDKIAGELYQYIDTNLP